MPKIRRTAKISRRAVRSRVLASLDEEPLKQHRHTAVQRTGRWDGFRQLMFGKDVSYPSTLEDLYTVPEVEMTDTCDGIDCQVLGVFGDACSVNVVLEFPG